MVLKPKTPAHWPVDSSSYMQSPLATMTFRNSPPKPPLSCIWLALTLACRLHRKLATGNPTGPCSSPPTFLHLASLICRNKPGRRTSQCGWLWWRLHSGIKGRSSHIAKGNLKFSSTHQCSPTISACWWPGIIFLETSEVNSIAFLVS